MLTPSLPHPRIFLAADVQAQDFTQFSGPTAQGFDTRLSALMERMDQAITAFHEEKPLDAIVMAGDFLDNRSAITLPVIELVTSYVRRWAALAPVYFLVGNHEQYKKAHSDITSLSMFEPYCTVVREASVKTIGGQPVAFSPFEADMSKIYSGLDMLAASGAKLLVGHWTVAGCTTGNEVMEHGILRDYSAFKAFDLILLGDIHLSQALNARMMYLGSPQQHDFGEKGDKFVWLLDGTTLTSFETQLPKFHRVDTLEEAKALRAAGHYVELRATDKASAEAGVELGVRVDRAYTETCASAERPALAGYREAVRWWAEKNLPADEVERMVSLGLKFFEGLKGSGFPEEDWVIGKVRGKNVMSYETIEFDLSASPSFVLLNGVVQVGQQCDSNGAGKTTIFEVPNIGIFGQSMRSGKQLALDIRDGADSMETSVEIKNVANTRAYRIERTVPGSLKLFFQNPSEDVKWTDISLGGGPATQAKIVEIFGDEDLFQMSCLLALHTFPSFLKRDEADKKAFIDRASGLAVFDDAQERVKESAKSVEVERGQLRTLLTVSETKITGATNLVAAAHGALTSERQRVIMQRESNRLDAERTRLEAGALAEPKKPTPPDVEAFKASKARAEAAVETSRGVHATALTNAANATAAREQGESDLAIARAALAPLVAMATASNTELQDTLVTLKGMRTDFDVRVKLLTTRITSLTNATKTQPKAGDTCKSCGYVYTGLEDAAQLRAHAEEELAKVNGELAELRAANDPVFADGAALEDTQRKQKADDDAKVKAQEGVIKALETSVNSLVQAERLATHGVHQAATLIESDLARVNECDAEIGLLGSVYATKVEAYTASHTVWSATVTRLLAAADAKEASAIPTTEEPLLAGLAKQEANVESLKDAHRDLETKLADLTAQLQDLEFWTKAFGNKGCKSLLYTSVIDALNDHIRKHSNIVSGGMFSIRLLPYSESAKGVVQEKISVEVDNAVGSKRIKGNSLGETTRVDIPVNLAVRDLIRDKGLKFNLLFVDEPWLGLDESGKKSIYSLLSSVRVPHGAIIVTDQSEFSKGNISAHQWTAKKTLVDGRGRSELLLHSDAPIQNPQVHHPQA